MSLEEFLRALIARFGLYVVLSALSRIAGDANVVASGCAGLPPALFDRDELGIDPEDPECPG